MNEGKLKERLIPIGKALDDLEHSEFSRDTTDGADGIRIIIDEAKQELYKIINRNDYEEIAYPELVEVIREWFGDGDE